MPDEVPEYGRRSLVGRPASFDKLRTNGEGMLKSIRESLSRTERPTSPLPRGEG
jgi:hypothetical protein